MLLTQTQLLELFLSLSDWQDRYRQIILLSKTLPVFPEQDRNTNNQIKGCENRVWLTYRQDSEHKLTFYGDSEGRIVKGLMVILFTLANGKTADDITQLDFLAVLKRLNIIEGLSSSRQLGIENIINQIKYIALSTERSFNKKIT